MNCTTRFCDTLHLLRILGPILLGHTSLSPEDIEELLSLNHGDVRLTLRGLHSLLSVPGPNPQSNGRYIHFFHASLPDFLRDRTRSSKYFIDANNRHDDLARCCLRILTELIPQDKR